MLRNNFFVIPKAFTFFLALASLVACKKDDPAGPDIAMGRLSIELTDAPTDDASVEGVFVTITELKVDGQTIEGFEPATLDVKAYQEGKVALLSDAEIAAKSYSSVSLVLDHTMDANGNTPGCYVMKTGGTKEELKAGAQTQTELTLNSTGFMVEEGQTAELVIDFDLRKAVKYENDTQYDFVAGADLANALRFVKKESTGTITGSVSNWDNHAEKVIVYAYHKGTFDTNTETQSQGDGQLKFKNAVTSAQAKADGSFELHFLESGDYELFIAGYDDDDQDGKFELKGSLNFDLVAGIDLSSIAVEANSNTRIDLSVIGILPL